MSKKTLYKLHKKIGMTLGFILFILGVSGVVVTYRDELMPVVYPGLFKVLPGGERVSVEQVVRAAQASTGNAITHLYTSERDDTATMLFTRPEGALLPNLITVNPYTGDVKGEMSLLSNIFGVMLYVHANLLLGKTGGYIVGFMGFLLVLFFITGVIIFWGHGIKERIARLPKAGVRGIHRGLGIFLGLPLVFSGITGCILAFDILGGGKPEDIVKNDVCVFENQIKTLNTLTKMQQDNIISVHFCSKKNALMKVSYGHEGRDGHEGFTKILIDPTSLEIKQAFDTRKDPPAWTRNSLTIYPLHTGSFFGGIGRFITLLTGFALSLLYITGLIAAYRMRKQHTALKESL